MEQRLDVIRVRAGFEIFRLGIIYCLLFYLDWNTFESISPNFKVYFGGLLIGVLLGFVKSWILNDKLKTREKQTILDEYYRSGTTRFFKRFILAIESPSLFTFDFLQYGIGFLLLLAFEQASLFPGLPLLSSIVVFLYTLKARKQSPFESSSYAEPK